MPACECPDGASDYGAYGCPDADAGDDEAERRPPLAGWEYLRHGDARERRYRCPAGALHDPSEDEHAKTRRRRADEAPRGESEETDRESAPDTENISDPSEERDADGEGQQKAGDHPPYLRLRDTVIHSYDGYDDVDHGTVEHRDEDGRDHNPDQEPARDPDLPGRRIFCAQATVQTGSARRKASSDARSARLSVPRLVEPSRNVPPVPTTFKPRSLNANLIISKICCLERPDTPQRIRSRVYSLPGSATSEMPGV